MEKDAMTILKEKYYDYYRTVMDWGMEYEVNKSFEYFIEQGFDEQEALIEALADWDLL